MEEKVMDELLKKASVLVEALPYIQRFNRKIIVVKYGGSAMADEQLKRSVIEDVTLLKLVGFKPIIVHGGGKEISHWAAKTGMESRFVNGLRYTDQETLDVVQMVLCGKVNKELVRLLQRKGGRAVGLCGIDGQMIHAEKAQSGEDLGLVGEVAGVNAAPILDVLEAGYIPVIATLGVGADGTVYNINADAAAARIAAELHAENLISLTDIRGLLRDRDDDATLISEVRCSELPALVRQGIVSGGMIPKVECCVEAVRRGVSRAFIIDGRIPHSILIEMMTNEGIGTMFLG